VARGGRRALALVAVSLLLAACGGSNAPVDGGPFTGKEATVAAVNIAYDPIEVSLPAGFPLRIVLDNKDSGVPHDIKVFQGDTTIAQSPVVTGPATTEVRFGPLTPATYQFMCTVHPNMLGTLVVTP
jgi:plastocyanin